jgi:hypothetical protein
MGEPLGEAQSPTVLALGILAEGVLVRTGLTPPSLGQAGTSWARADSRMKPLSAESRQTGEGGPGWLRV